MGSGRSGNQASKLEEGEGVQNFICKSGGLLCVVGRHGARIVPIPRVSLSKYQVRRNVLSRQGGHIFYAVYVVVVVVVVVVVLTFASFPKSSPCSKD